MDDFLLSPEACGTLLHWQCQGHWIKWQKHTNTHRIPVPVWTLTVLYVASVESTWWGWHWPVIDLMSKMSCLSTSKVAHALMKTTGTTELCHQCLCPDPHAANRWSPVIHLDFVTLDFAVRRRFQFGPIVLYTVIYCHHHCCWRLISYFGYKVMQQP